MGCDLIQQALKLLSKGYEKRPSMFHFLFDGHGLHPKVSASFPVYFKHALNAIRISMPNLLFQFWHES